MCVWVRKEGSIGVISCGMCGFDYRNGFDGLLMSIGLPDSNA